MKRTDMYTNSQYLQQHPTWDGEEAVLKAGWIRKMIDDQQLPVDTVIEAGCGSGRILSELSKYFPAAYFKGYDLSPQAIAIAKQYQTDKINFFEANFLKEQHVVADLLLLIDVLEHVPDYYGMLEGLHSRATHYIFHIPLDLCCRSILKPELLMQQRQNSGHIHYFSKEMVLWMLHDTGYQVMDWQYTKPVSDLEAANSMKGRTKKTIRNFSFNISKDRAVKWWGGYSMLIAARAI
ncbi:MAG: class I SAM-dependent methyltransferase [Chitinophagaceae bacterium]